MRTYHANNLGFSKTITIFFIIITISILGVFMSTYRKNSSSGGRVNMDIRSNPPDLAVTTPTSELSGIATINEFDIPELNIKLALPDGLTGLKYSINNNTPGIPIAYFYTTSLGQMVADSKCMNGGPIGAIAVMSQDPKTFTDSAVAATKQLGGSYVIYQQPQGLCSNNVDAIKLQISQMNSLKQAISSVASIK